MARRPAPGNRIAIVVDGRVEGAPAVVEQIVTGTLIISPEQALSTYASLTDKRLVPTASP